MNVLGARERTWRKAKKRAVSPIIATILLVAITVVLAAVLYVLISGLTHGPGNTPIGSAFAMGNPSSANNVGSGAGSTCVAATTTTVAGAIKTADWTYQLTIEQASLSFSGLGLEVKAAGGAVLAGGAGGIYVVNTGGNVVACGLTTAANGFAITSWTFPVAQGATSSTPVTTLMSIYIDTGSAAGANPWAGAGNTANGVGTGSYSGTSQAVTLP